MVEATETNKLFEEFREKAGKDKSEELFLEIVTKDLKDKGLVRK